MNEPIRPLSLLALLLLVSLATLCNTATAGSSALLSPIESAMPGLHATNRALATRSDEKDCPLKARHHDENCRVADKTSNSSWELMLLYERATEEDLQFSECKLLTLLTNVTGGNVTFANLFCLGHLYFMEQTDLIVVAWAQTSEISLTQMESLNSSLIACPCFHGTQVDFSRIDHRIKEGPRGPNWVRAVVLSVSCACCVCVVMIIAGTWIMRRIHARNRGPQSLSYFDDDDADGDDLTFGNKFERSRKARVLGSINLGDA